MSREEFETIDAYIEGFDGEIKDKLLAIKACIKAAAPEASGKISWAMPTFYLYGNLVHFAAHKTHIGFYPGTDGVLFFNEKTNGFQSSKGGIQLPFSKPMPFDIISETVKFRVKQNTDIFNEKQKNKNQKNDE